jgi:hypothetical protein
MKDRCDQIFSAIELLVRFHRWTRKRKKLTGQPLQEHELPQEQLDPHAQEPLELHPQSEPAMLIDLVGWVVVVFCVEECIVLKKSWIVMMMNTCEQTKQFLIYPKLRDLCGFVAYRTSRASLPGGQL